MKLFFLLLFILFLLIMAAGWYMARFACRRQKKIPDYWTHPEALPPIYHLIREEGKAEILAGREFMLTHAEPPVYITSRDGLKLQGHYIPAAGAYKDNPRGIYLQVHGYRAHPLCDFPGCVLDMHNAGYGLFQIDNRALGGSEGKYITFGILERYDTVDWCRYLEKRFPGVPVLLDGISMGGAIVMLTSGEDLPDNIRGVIADCGYTSPADICKKVLKQWFHLPPFPIYYAAVLWIRILTGVWFSLPGKSEKNRYRTGDTTLALEKNKLPILLAHGQEDSFVPHWMSVRNFSHCDPDNSTFISVPNAEHGMSWLDDKERYKEAIFRLWEKVEQNINT